MAIDPSQITLGMMIDEVKRELVQRGRVYPKLVGAGKMKAHHAELQTAIMEKIRATLEEMRPKKDGIDGYGTKY